MSTLKARIFRISDAHLLKVRKIGKKSRPPLGDAAVVRKLIDEA